MSGIPRAGTNNDGPSVNQETPVKLRSALFVLIAAPWSA